ncbi:testis-expressed protein 264 homolog [Symsagittifera roscoffensis]|uniref:testis-expressed protein 264 homolog n=1 Tax=Symsagittifera roscoffensis TaxID=84072 RepID=UPI00307BED59
MDSTVLILIGIGALIVALFLTVFYMLVLSGLFESVDVKATKKHLLNKSRIIAYKTYKGSYGQVGDAFSWLCRTAPYNDTIGIYYDDPKTVPVDECRYIVGAIVETCVENRMSLEEVIQRLEEEEYQFFQMPGSTDPVEKEGELEKEGESGKGDATSDEGVGTPMVHCTFPFVNTLSIMIAVRRVYPALQKYISDNKLKTGAYPFIEYCHDSTLHFLVPCLDNQRFFVPEFCEENKQFAAEKYSDLVKH